MTALSNLKWQPAGDNVKASKYIIKHKRFQKLNYINIPIINNATNKLHNFLPSVRVIDYDLRSLIQDTKF